MIWMVMITITIVSLFTKMKFWKIHVIIIRPINHTFSLDIQNGSYTHALLSLKLAGVNSCLQRRMFPHSNGSTL